MKTTAVCLLLLFVVAIALAVPVEKGEVQELPVFGEAAEGEGPGVLVEKREVNAEGEEGPIVAVEGQPFYVKSPPKNGHGGH